jgi:hypothetical protein
MTSGYIAWHATVDGDRTMAFKYIPGSPLLQRSIRNRGKRSLVESIEHLIDSD